MRSEEIKKEAMQRLRAKLDATDDELVLIGILDMLDTIETGNKRLDLSRHYDAIKSKYGDVLNKLAQ